MIEILNRKKRIEIEEKLAEDFFIELPLQHQFIQQARDKIRIFTGNLGAQDLIRLSKLLTIDAIGLYFSFMKEKEFRLSYDASILYGQSSKKVIELNEKEAREWLKGQDLKNRWKKQGYFMIKYNKDIIGCCKATDEKLMNFVPKERRIDL